MAEVLVAVVLVADVLVLVAGSSLLGQLAASILEKLAQFESPENIEDEDEGEGAEAASVGVSPNAALLVGRPVKGAGFIMMCRWECVGLVINLREMVIREMVAVDGRD